MALNKQFLPEFNFLQTPEWLLGSPILQWLILFHRERLWLLWLTVTAEHMSLKWDQEKLFACCAVWLIVWVRLFHSNVTLDNTSPIALLHSADGTLFWEECSLQRAAWESVEWWMRSKYTHYCISSMKISFYHTNKAHTYAMLTPQKCFLSTWWRTFLNEIAQKAHLTQYTNTMKPT